MWYLARVGYLTSSKRGVWSLAERARSEPIDESDCYRLFKEVRATLNRPAQESNGAAEAVETEEAGEAVAAPIDHREHLLGILKGLPPAGFERVCQRLLRESGFHHVAVTGRSGVGGIDGIGILQLNGMLSFRVLFQCKRYSGSIGAPMLRDFRGAMQGRADKGIFITTGTFTSEARREAIRDGVPPIELVDAEQLVQMFEDLQLALKPRTIYEVDLSFFNEYQNHTSISQPGRP